MRQVQLLHLLPVAAGLLVAGTLPAADEEWPRFRGPTGQGISGETGLPVRWSATENVAWKTAIPGEGWSSPIVWGESVFVTTAAEEGASLRVLRLERRSGKPLWNKEVARQTPGRKEGKNSHATPTPATDGERLYAVFNDGTIAALSFDGAVAWMNREVKFHSKHGLGASPIIHEDLLLMPFDGSSAGDDPRIGWKVPWDKAVILALDRRSGEVRWRGSRGASRLAHVTPTVLRQAGADQLVSAAGDVVQGHDLKTGERLWSAHSQGEGVVPSILTGDGLIFTASGFEKPTIRALRPGGKGDVTATHIAWEQTRGVPSQSSLLHVKPYLYAITDGGVATCYRAETGEVVWQQRIGGKHSASPISAEGRIYFLSESGESVVIEAGPEYREVARSTIDERCQASYAVSRGQVFIRSERHLFCIGKLRGAASIDPAPAAGAVEDESFERLFRPPPEPESKPGRYRSPLLFRDGTRVADARDWARRREEIVAEWNELLGPWPEVIESPRVEVLAAERREGIEHRRVRLDLAPRVSGEGWLLVPEGGRPRPAVLVVYYEPETSAGLKPDQPHRDFGLQLARRGFVTLSIGTPGGDARKPELGRAVCQPLSFHAYVAANCWNALARLPEVDRERIGVVGHSYGGKWAMFAAALWDRFAAVAVSDPGIVFDESRPNVNYWEPWYLGLDPGTPSRKPGVPGAENPRTGAYKLMIERGRDLHELHALICPRPFFVSGGSEDPPERWDALRHAVEVNRILGHEGRAGMSNRKDHTPDPASNAQIYAFFEKFLGTGKPAASSPKE